MALLWLMGCRGCVSIDSSKKYPGLHSSSSLSPTSPSNSLNTSQNSLLGFESLQSSPQVERQDKNPVTLSATIGSSSFLTASRDASRIFEEIESSKQKKISISEAIGSSITDFGQFHKNSSTNNDLNNNKQQFHLSTPKFPSSSFRDDNCVEDGYIML